MVRVAHRELAREEITTIGDGAERQVVIEPRLETADVEHAGATPAGLDDVGAADGVEAEAGDVLHERLAGPELDLEPGRDAEPGPRCERIPRGRALDHGDGRIGPGPNGDDDGGDGGGDGDGEDLRGHAASVPDRCDPSRADAPGAVGAYRGRRTVPWSIRRRSRGLPICHRSTGTGIATPRKPWAPAARSLRSHDGTPRTWLGPTPCTTLGLCRPPRPSLLPNASASC